MKDASRERQRPGWVFLLGVSMLLYAAGYLLSLFFTMSRTRHNFSSAWTGAF